MKVSILWLKDYLSGDFHIDELPPRLVMAGIGVAGVEHIQNDTIIDLEIPANRPDLLSVTGVAREISILLGLKFKSIILSENKGKDEIRRYLSVEVLEPELCPRYTARLVKGLKVAPSPDWLANRLISCGIRPINNIVDITNYVLLETGQPLHAFDLHKLQGAKIIVRRAKQGEGIVAIDGKRYELASDFLIIADAKDPVAIAGVMGGKGSEISDSTADVIIESAEFHPAGIRRTSRHLGLYSESSYRFERGVHFETVDIASRRAQELMIKLGNGTPCKDSIDIIAIRPVRNPILVRQEKVNKILGANLTHSNIIDILGKLGFKIEVKNDKAIAIKVLPPYYRKDITLEADVAEEIARIYGYDKLPSSYELPLSISEKGKSDIIEIKIKELLCSLGYFEVLTSSFAQVSDIGRYIERFQTFSPELYLKDEKGKPVKVLRKSLIPELLAVYKTNASYGEALEGIFEISKVYFLKDREGQMEKNNLGIVSHKGFAWVKSTIEQIAELLGIKENLEFAGTQGLEWYIQGHSLLINVGNENIGHMGDILPKEFDIKEAVTILEIHFEKLCKIAEKKFGQTQYVEFPRFPAIRRDLAVVVSENIPWRKIEDCIKRSAGVSLEEIRFFDLYKGKQIPQGKKSIAFSMSFRAKDRTLSNEEIDIAIKNIIDALEREIGGDVRKK